MANIISQISVYDALYDINAKSLNIARLSNKVLTKIAVDLDLNTEIVYFAGSDGTSLECPENYCILRVIKGDNHRTLIDCYCLTNGNHYINSNIHSATTTGWTGWKLQPNPDNTYTKTEIDNLISVNDIDTICNTGLTIASMDSGVF